VQLSVLHAPSPAVTPTNLRFNVVAGPGALLRYRKQGHLTGPLTGCCCSEPCQAWSSERSSGSSRSPASTRSSWSSPRCYCRWGCGSARRRLVAADTRLPGRWQPARSSHWRWRSASSAGSTASAADPRWDRSSSAAATRSSRSPAALTSTFLTSAAGATTYALIGLSTTGDITPDWTVGLLCGLGGLIGSYLGARLQPRLPETALRLPLGVLATALALLYLHQATAQHG
jgi:hypothetical protein